MEKGNSYCPPELFYVVHHLVLLDPVSLLTPNFEICFVVLDSMAIGDLYRTYLCKLRIFEYYIVNWIGGEDGLVYYCIAMDFRTINFVGF